MRGLWLGLAGSTALAWMGLAQGAPWSFGEPVDVSGPPRAEAFHHLEAAGRGSLAVGPNTVSVVWEDSSSGAPQAYAARAAGDGGRFDEPRRLSTGPDAFEPAIVAVGAGRFLAAWEQNGRVWARSLSAAGPGPARRLDGAPSRQVTLVEAGDNLAYAAWIREVDGHGRVVWARLSVSASGAVQDEPLGPVDPDPPPAAQAYPTLAGADAGLVAAWEDRRHGHTRLYVSRAERGEDAALRFGAPRQLNELPPPMSTRYGRGTGVTRVVLDAAGQERVAATWMDKRQFKGGYDIYAAVSDDGGRSFGPNEKAQDMFGEHNPQWHPDVAVAPDGTVVVAWDDPRDGTADVWLSWRGEDGQWSDDLAVPGASGPGDQTHPVLDVDAAGSLHLAWLDRSGAGTRIRYVKAPPR